MPIIVLHRDELKTAAVPEVLEAYISDGQWAVIRGTLIGVQKQAQGLTCAGELTACLCCGIWCVFCFHPCIYNLVLEQAWQNEPKKLNQTLFSGAPVISLLGQSIVFNTDNLPVSVGTAVAPYQHVIVQTPLNAPNQPPTAWIMTTETNYGYERIPTVGIVEDHYNHVDSKVLPSSAPSNL